jgi:hypothetical protein
VSFVLDLDASPDSWEIAHRLADVTREPEYVSLLPADRCRWLRKPAPRVYLDHREADEILADEASTADREFPFSPRREALARTLLAIASELGSGWTLRSYWIGDAVRGEVPITAVGLADLVRNSALNRWALYRVVDDRAGFD